MPKDAEFHEFSCGGKRNNRFFYLGAKFYEKTPEFGLEKVLGSQKSDF